MQRTALPVAKRAGKLDDARLAGTVEGTVSAATQAGSPFELYPAAVQRREVLEQVIAEEEKGGKRALLPVVR